MTADPFRIRDHVASFDDIVDDIRTRSIATRRTVAMEANVAYGGEPGETLDIFLPNGTGSDMPIHMFIHGGYWRMFSKEDYSCVAETVTRAGAVAAIVDYSLMPMARMDVLIGQVLNAKAFCWRMPIALVPRPADFPSVATPLVPILRPFSSIAQ